VEPPSPFHSDDDVAIEAITRGKYYAVHGLTLVLGIGCAIGGCFTPWAWAGAALLFIVSGVTAISARRALVNLVLDMVVDTIIQASLTNDRQKSDYERAIAYVTGGLLLAAGLAFGAMSLLAIVVS
jgi:hypothetical protein